MSAPRVSVSYLQSGAYAAPIFVPEADCTEWTDITLNNGDAVSDHSVVLLAQGCRQLKQLSLTGCDTLTDLSLQALGQHCNKLNSVQLSAQSGAVTDTGLVQLVQGCRQLSTIDLWDCSSVTAGAFIATSPLCARFHVFKLDQCTAFGDKTVQSVMNRLQNLVSLTVCDNAGFTEQLLVSVIKNNPQLNIIVLAGAACVSNAVVAAMAGCVQLWRVDIRNCSNVTDIAALSVCPELAFLYLRGCRGVLDATVLQLASTPGEKISVCARDSGVSAAALANLAGSTRVNLDLTRSR